MMNFLWRLLLWVVHAPPSPGKMVCSCMTVIVPTQSNPPLCFLQSPVHPTRCQGGISCASPGRPHTHTVSWLVNKAPGTANEDKSCLHTSSLSSSHSTVRGRHDTIVIAFPYQKDDRFLGKQERTSVYSGIFFSAVLLMSWDAGGAQREQQVGKIKSLVLSLSPQRPGVCLL